MYYQNFLKTTLVQQNKMIYSVNAIFTSEEVSVYYKHIMAIHSREWRIGKSIHSASLLLSTLTVNCWEKAHLLILLVLVWKKNSEKNIYTY